MSKVGYISTIAIDPDLHNGNDQAAAIVTRVHEDGTYNLRVFSDDPLTTDEFRTHVDLDGAQHDYEKASEPATGSDAPAVAPPAAAEPVQPAAPAAAPVADPSIVPPNAPGAAVPAVTYGPAQPTNS